MVMVAESAYNAAATQHLLCIVGLPCVVVSPLIALMEDQVAALTARGISAAFLGSAQTNAEVWWLWHVHGGLNVCNRACPQRWLVDFLAAG
jgi:hypothetical protein